MDSNQRPPPCQGGAILSIKRLLRNCQIFRNQQDLRAPPYRSSSADLQWGRERAFFDSCIPRGAADSQNAQDLRNSQQSVIGGEVCFLHMYVSSRGITACKEQSCRARSPRDLFSCLDAQLFTYQHAKTKTVERKAAVRREFRLEAGDG